jgi:hypothetical protein
MSEDERIVRVPLPVPLIRRMDELVLKGTGGYQTRAEFIREAVEAMVLELSYEPAPEEPRPHAATLLANAPPAAAGPPGAQPAPAEPLRAPALNLEETRLGSPPPSITLDDGEGIVIDEPMFGLHNRDYPSLWAAHHLAGLTADALVGLDEFYRTLVNAAWEFGERLLALEKALGAKLSALFPTNRAKPQSAEEGFRVFAVGTCTANGQELRLGGPLFMWRVSQVTRREGRLLVGLTSAGRELLTALEDVSLEMPHPPGLAERFFAHLRAHAPQDWWGFTTLLEAVEAGATRVELIDVFQQAQPTWNESKNATNVAGYVARAREWGLVEPKQVDGRYALTPFGKHQLDEERGDA